MIDVHLGFPDYLQAKNIAPQFRHSDRLEAKKNRRLDAEANQRRGGSQQDCKERSEDRVNDTGRIPDHADDAGPMEVTEDKEVSGPIDEASAMLRDLKSLPEEFQAQIREQIVS